MVSFINIFIHTDIHIFIFIDILVLLAFCIGLSQCEDRCRSTFPLCVPSALESFFSRAG